MNTWSARLFVALQITYLESLHEQLRFVLLQEAPGYARSQKLSITSINLVTSLCPSVRPPACVSAAPTGWISLKFYITHIY